MRLASRFGYANQIRRDRPLTHEELMHYVPGIFGEDKHTSRSQNYTYIPTITVLESLQREGFQPFFACQTRVRDPGRRGYTKHMLRLRRAGEINGEHVPEIILLNSHDGTSSYQMLPGYFRFVCQNGCVCGQSLGEVRVPHRGNVVDRVIEGAYEVVGVFDRIEEKTKHGVSELPVNWWVQPSVIRTFSSRGDMSMGTAAAGSNMTFSPSRNGTSLDLQAGLEARVRENITLGVQAGYAHSVSGNSAEGYNGQATLNVTF